MANAETEDQQQTVEELQRERDEAVSNYEKLTKAHTRLKEDLSSMKANLSDVSELQKQIQNHIVDKTKMLREKEELQATFDGYRKEIRAKETKQLLSTKLEEAGAKAPTTALKLLDMEAVKFDDKGQVVPETLDAAIAALKESDGILFADAEPNRTKPTTPSVKHAVDRMTASAFETEMAAAVKAGDQAQLEEVFNKYHKS